MMVMMMMMMARPLLPQGKRRPQAALSVSLPAVLPLAAHGEVPQPQL